MKTRNLKMHLATASLLSLQDEALRSGRVALLCNQCSWDFNEGRYLFEILYERNMLHRLFMPEHGLFAELQDQEKLDLADFYSCLGLEGVDFVSLYGSSEASLSAPLEKLKDIDAIIIDLQDVGCRYYTFVSTVYKLFQSLKKHGLNIPVYILDRPNPAGRQVEGTLLSKEYSSFIGVSGLIHRHGLTIGELCSFLHSSLNAAFPLTIVPYTFDSNYTIPVQLPAAGSSFVKTPCAIYPSPNIPSPYTCLVYSGQCLFEGTNLSEGRGTTRPFEIVGAPFLREFHHFNRKFGFRSWNDSMNPVSSRGALLRMLHFIPTFHKYAGELCYGFQLHLNGKPYHSLEHSLRMIRMLASELNDFKWRQGVYEQGNDRIAIELLAGDRTLLDYLNGKQSLNHLHAALTEGEEEWIKTVSSFTIYPEKLFRVNRELMISG